MRAGGFHQPKADGSDAGVNAENFHTAPLSYLIDSTIKPFLWQCFSERGKTGWSNSNPFHKFMENSFLLRPDAGGIKNARNTGNRIDHSREPKLIGNAEERQN